MVPAGANSAVRCPSERNDSSDDDSACTGTSRLTMPIRFASRLRSGRLRVVM